MAFGVIGGNDLRCRMTRSLHLGIGQRCRSDPAWVRFRAHRRAVPCRQDGQAIATVDHAWTLGDPILRCRPALRLRDRGATAGAALRNWPRDEYTLSTKVGRVVRPADRVPPGADIDHQARDGRDDAYYADVGDRRVVFDYSAEGVTRSLAESLARLGLDRVDLVYIHDPTITGRPSSTALIRPSIGCASKASSVPSASGRTSRRCSSVSPARPRWTLSRCRPVHAARPGCPAGSPAGVPGARYLGAHRRGDEQRRPGRPATWRSLRLRPGEPRILWIARGSWPSRRAMERPFACSRHPVPARPSRRGRTDRRRPAHRASRRVPGVHALADPAWPVG